MARRKRPVGRKIYTIPYLLDKQPKGLAKDPRYKAMIDSLANEERLISLRFNRRCYSLLHDGVIKPENLDDFYRTYRLPRHPFFPLFLAIKRSYLSDRSEKKQDKEKTIAVSVGRLSPLLKAYWTAFSRWESKCRGGKKAVLFNRIVYPSSIKKARDYLSRSHGEWILFFEEYLNKVLEENHIRYDREGEMLLDRFILKLPPPPTVPVRGDIIRGFRTLSLEYHPDKGGDAEFFLKIKEARERLLPS
jgi:hypothetical protein